MTNQTPDQLMSFVQKAQTAQAAVNEEVRKATEGGRFADAQHPQGYPKPSPKWFITFGLGTPNRNQYALMQAQEYSDARDEAFRRYGRHWGFMYAIEELEPMQAQYGAMTLRAD